MNIFKKNLDQAEHLKNVVKDDDNIPTLRYPKEMETNICIEWEEKLKEFRENVLKDEILRKERIERAEKEKKSWELTRWCKEYLSKHEPNWKVDKLAKLEREKLEREKVQRFIVIEKKRKKTFRKDL